MTTRRAPMKTRAQLMWAQYSDHLKSFDRHTFSITAPKYKLPPETGWVWVRVEVKEVRP